MSEELKKCPFCGGEANIKAVNKRYGFTVWVECRCGAKAMPYCADLDNEDTTITNIEKCKTGAIEAWNRRVNDEDRD